MRDASLQLPHGRVFTIILVLPLVIGFFLIGLNFALGPAEARMARGIALTMLGVLIWMVAVTWLLRRVSESVAHLEAAAQRVASGDYSALELRPMPTPYLSNLQNAFDLMIQRLNETRDALDRRVNEERRIREELQSLQRQVIRQERLAAVGLLVSGVAHEINNPLQAILGFAELLQMQHNLPDTVNNDLRLIQRESARACGIIRNLALFARQQPGQAASVRMGDIITSVAELRQRRLQSEDIELVIDDTATYPIMAVFTELQQVVLNFVVNAEQGIVASGRLPGRITIRARDEDNRILLEVEDVSYGIIDSMGGRIGYRRAPAGGAIFYFDLPAATAV
jgi:C4-dicarboxylate-specific signal transduction histidine kinase